MTIRAKFRCMETARRYDSSRRAEFLPVCKHTAGSPEDAAENKSFWTATPAGSIKLEFRAERSMPYEPGPAWYVDFEAAPEGTWTLGDIHLYGQGSAKVVLRAPWGGDPMSSGTVEMSIDNPTAVAAFVGVGVGSKWSVTFSR